MNFLLLGSNLHVMDSNSLPPHPHNIWDKKKMALVMWGGFNLQLASIFLACPFCLKDLRASRCVTIDTSRTELTQSGTAPIDII